MIFCLHLHLVVAMQFKVALVAVVAVNSRCCAGFVPAAARFAVSVNSMLL